LSGDEIFQNPFKPFLPDPKLDVAFSLWARMEGNYLDLETAIKLFCAFHSKIKMTRWGEGILRETRRVVNVSNAEVSKLSTPEIIIKIEGNV
jgi:hypothetical protein